MSEIKDEIQDVVVNPEDMVEICFWCGEPMNPDLKDIDDLQPVITSYTPCPECKKIIGDNIHVIGSTKEPIVKDMPPIFEDEETGDKVYPTGSMFVAPPSFAKELLSGEDLKEKLDAVLEAKVLILKEEYVKNIIEQVRAAEENAEEGKENEKNIQSEDDQNSAD